MAAGNEDDPVFGRGGSGSYLHISRDALLADDPHEAYNHTHDRHNPIGIAVWVVIGLAVAGSIGWYIYSRLPSSAPAYTEIPILQAVPEAVKVRPENPGGLDVPNRDKLIYQQMGEVSAGSGNEEHLLPPIETPAEPPEGPFSETVISPVAPMPAPGAIIAPPVTLTPPETAIRPEQPVSSLSELIARHVKLPPVHRTLEGKSSIALPMTRQPAAPVTAPSSASPISKATVGASRTAEPRGGERKSSSSTTLPMTRPAAPATMPSSAPPPMSKVAVGALKSARSGGEAARLQLGSFKSTEDAEKAWLQLVGRHRDLLSSISHTLVQVELGMKGSWYRVYAGPYSDMQTALSVCNALKQRNVGCIFARK